MSNSLKTAQAVAGFKARNVDWEAKLTTEYSNNVYILKEGDLEAYLEIGKDLSEVIDFCRNELPAFLRNDASSKSVEVRQIIQRIIE